MCELVYTRVYISLLKHWEGMEVVSKHPLHWKNSTPKETLNSSAGAREEQSNSGTLYCARN